MNILKFIGVFFSIFILIGCAKDGEEFVGIWSNQNENGGDIKLVISRDGDKFLVKKSFISNGATFGVYPAISNGEYLIVEGEKLFSKLAYSQTEDSLLPIPLDGLGWIPGFHRIK